VLAPTRELADQINESIRALGRHTHLRSAAVYGGVNIARQIKTFSRGVEIVVACPGRLLDHISRGTVDLSGVSCLVLDEADRMFDMGFLPDIRRILKVLPRERQTMLFSATMPREIRGLAEEVLRNPETVQAGALAPVSTVSHALYSVAEGGKGNLLMELLGRSERESVIVFTRTKHRARKVARQLEKAGHPATSLQGNLSQNQRQRAIEGFRKGRYTIMVATDIASRGIDVSQVSHVINYDVPDTVEAYTHRIGRTGRVARTGEAFTFATAEDGTMIRAIERVLGERIPCRGMEGYSRQGSDTAGDGSKAFRRPKGRYASGRRRPAGKGDHHGRPRSKVA
jgi:ATP-dependent RNA helicase RhlE